MAQPIKTDRTFIRMDMTSIKVFSTIISTSKTLCCLSITPNHCKIKKSVIFIMVEAVMFDIDDTLITSQGVVIKPIVEILNRCLMSGYRVVIITARPGGPENRQWTKDQLARHRIGYHELYFCPPENKSKIKQSLGYNFILSVGDQPTDLTDSQNYINTSTFCRN